MDVLYNPFVSVGPFVFNDNIDQYTDLGLLFYESDDVTGWDCYELLDEGVEVYTSNSIIVSVACRKELFYAHMNIIGQNIDVFLSNLQIHTRPEIDKIYIPSEDEYQDVFEIESLGLQLWVRHDIIVTAFCSPDLSKED